jgi:L-aminopeptidase/D-esterase-like protein
MRPCNLVERIHAVMLAGGSAFGLDAACGAMQFLEERAVGFDTGYGVVPIVGAAVIFDLDIGDPKVRPDKRMGYAACAAASAGPPAEGNSGAGLGATVGKTRGARCSMKGGTGTWSVRLPRPGGALEPVVVGAIVVVNALGDVVDPDSARVIAGAYDRDTRRFLQPDISSAAAGAVADVFPSGNTTLAVVATDARLDKEGANKLAQMAHDGLARVIRPIHTMYDGDVVFALSTGDKPLTGDKATDVTVLGAAAAEVVAVSVLRAVGAATTAAGVPAARDVASGGRG